MTTYLSLSQPSLSQIFSVFNQLSALWRNKKGVAKVIVWPRTRCGSVVIDDIYITNVGIPIVLNCRLLPPLDTVINHKHGVQSDIVSFNILNTDTVLIHSSCISN